MTDHPMVTIGSCPRNGNSPTEEAEQLASKPEPGSRSRPLPQLDSDHIYVLCFVRGQSGHCSAVMGAGDSSYCN